MTLAQNAKDAITMAGRGHLIQFRCGRAKGEILLEVEDDGPGRGAQAEAVQRGVRSAISR